MVENADEQMEQSGVVRIMQKNFDYFVQKIPANIHDNTRSIFTEHLALFIPEKFVMDKPMYVEEYHFVICFTTPPLAIIRGAEYQFARGSLICLAPGDDILVHAPDQPLSVKYMTICVNPQFMQNVHVQTGGKDVLRFASFDSRFSYLLLEALEALIHEVVTYGTSNSLMMTSLENRIAIQLLRDSKSEFSDLKQNQHMQENVEKALKYIETYYASNITINDICEAIYISPPYLQKIFVKYVGKTPYQYIMECRHQKAKELLETTSVSVEEIARQCGFVNHAHFSTTFKKMQGVSPLAFRKTCWKD